MTTASRLVVSALMGVAFSAAIVLAGEVIERQTTTTTTYSGTMADVSPATSTLVIKSPSLPEGTTYRYTKTTTWVDGSGNPITSEQARNSPVTAHYVKDGDSMIVTKIVADTPTVEETTTTTTTETR